MSSSADDSGSREGAAAHRLGAALRLRRLEMGLSQRQLARLIGLSAHSNLGDYERGQRIPPGDIVVACEQLLSVEPDYLQALRREALSERARRLCSIYDTAARPAIRRSPD
ncbi:helix-turn-helix transcriptional regulator [Actinocrinis puniceicyclus]|uniref:Helix-turn-helix transcriptional regulator n=1 Tax=Actinocrinis puniceicyclus TaxID=977794 RepID=A0A8J8BCG0_9ACTN|nr:helix-turn-helix transcriptional regulator [Actinocrinis puniceicyclus]MBS2964118.1 helix-turn-helix transcriptional regulator [Actinocrinis puniceicyclus]